MSETDKDRGIDATPKEKFLGAMRKIITVPKTEVLRREREAKAERARKRKKQ
ncbi:MAG: hypothetical protein ABSH14_10115 [Verrucomicrobiia bacterium]|jgi:hypothetical protein